LAYKVSAVVKAAQNARTNNKAESDRFIEEASLQRDSAVNEWYEKGGELVIKWIKEHYRTHSGDKLSWDEPFFCQFVLAFANPWLEKLIISKAAQVGWSEILIAFCAFSLSYLRSPIALGFEEQRKVFKMVGERIQIAFDKCEPLKELSRQSQQVYKRQDIDSKQSITIAGVPLELFYSKVQASKDDEQSASGLRSFTTRIACVDEFGLCSPGILDALAPRFGQSRWRTKPVRAGSTPAMEGGIVDTEVRKAKYIFQWKITCPTCNCTQFLDAFGNFLKPVEVTEDGVIEVRYVDKMGRPLKWFHYSENPPGVNDWQLQDRFRDEAIATAYIGCQDCEIELEKETLDAGEFVCTNTGVTLKELNRYTLENQEAVRETVAMHLPKLASWTFDPVERIRFMWTTKKPALSIQEMLGKAISLGGGKIALSQLQACVGLPVPFTRKPDIVVAGLDQGRYSHFLVITAFHFTDNPDKELAWMDGHAEVLDWREIADFSELEALSRKFNINAVGIDNEPEFNPAVNFALQHLPGQRPVYSRHCTANVRDRKAIPIFEPYLQRYGWAIAKFTEHGRGNLPSQPYLAEYTLFPLSDQSWNVRDLDKFFQEKLPNQVEFVLEDEFWEPGQVKAGHRFQVYLFDQVELKGEQWRRTLRKVKSTKNSSRVKGQEELVPVYLLDRTYGLDTVRDRIYRRKMHFPAHTTYDPKDNANLLHHFLTSDRLPGGWIEPPGAPDHFFHAACFADLCALIAQREPGMGGMSFTGIPVDQRRGGLSR
jgi:hypothetical protein